MLVPADSSETTSGRSVGLWAGVIGAPAVWAIQLQAVYALAPWVSGPSMHLVTHTVSLLCLLLASASGWLSWREWQNSGGGSPDLRGGSSQDRLRFLAGLGVFSSILFGILIIFQAIPAFFFDAGVL